jgi:hypothetical protein
LGEQGTLPFPSLVLYTKGVRQIRAKLVFQSQRVCAIEFRAIALARKSIEQEVTSESAPDSVRSTIKGRTSEMIAGRPAGRAMNFIPEQEPGLRAVLRARTPALLLGIKGNYDRPSFGAAGECLIGVLRY